MFDALVFDADHTLIDYTFDEKEAFKRLFASFSVPFNEETLSLSQTLSEEVWTEEGLYDVFSERIQREYHDLYRSHLIKLFIRLAEEKILPVPPDLARDCFLKELETGGKEMPNALKTVKSLSEKYPVYIATNGLSVMQRKRLSEFKPYVKEIFVSEDFGVIKPCIEFFDKILLKMQKKSENCLFIGDSVSSDIVGAMGAGMKTCWYNSRKQKNGSGITPDYSVQDLTELIDIL